MRIFGPTAARTLERLVGEVRKLPPDVHPIVQTLWCQPKCFRAMADHLAVLEETAAVVAAVTSCPMFRSSLSRAAISRRTRSRSINSLRACHRRVGTSSRPRAAIGSSSMNPISS